MVPTVVARLCTRLATPPVAAAAARPVDLCGDDDAASVASAVLFNCPSETLIRGLLCCWLLLSSFDGILGLVVVAVGDLAAALCSASIDLGLASWSSLDMEAVLPAAVFCLACCALDLESGAVGMRSVRRRCAPEPPPPDPGV